MKIKSIILITVLVLGACSNRHHVTQQQPSLPAETAKPEPSTAPIISDAPSEQTVINQQPTIEIVETVAYQDVFDRIRNGFSMPNLSSKHVTHYEQWNSQHPTYLVNLFERAEPFLFYIVEELEKRDLPMELALLPAVESAFKTNAYSRSKAAGLWQFIPSTGRYFKLRQDWWYDGRYDVIESTQAALDYLTRLNKEFNGDWFLALASYNAGAGNIRKAIRHNQKLGKSTHFSALKLRSETTRYVPKLIALKNIINNPDLFKVKLPVIKNQAYFTQLDLPRQVDLSKFSKASGINLKELNNLNAGFLRWASAPEGPNRILIPNNYLETAKKAINELEKTPFTQFKHHRIAQGDTLSGIAKRYKVSVPALKQANNLNNTKIRAGRSLVIPVRGATFTPLTSNKQNNKVIHKVKHGDTLWSIARRYQVKVKQLLAWNQLSSNQILNLNQSVLIYR